MLERRDHFEYVQKHFHRKGKFWTLEMQMNTLNVRKNNFICKISDDGQSESNGNKIQLTIAIVALKDFDDSL